MGTFTWLSGCCSSLPSIIPPISSSEQEMKGTHKNAKRILLKCLIGKNQGQSDKNRLNRQLRPTFGIQFLDAVVGSDGSEAAVDRHLQLAGIGMCLSVAEGMLDALLYTSSTSSPSFCDCSTVTSKERSIEWHSVRCEGKMNNSNRTLKAERIRLNSAYTTGQE